MTNNDGKKSSRASSRDLVERARKRGLLWIDVVHAGLTVTDLDMTILTSEGWGGRPGNYRARVRFGCCGKEMEQNLQSVVQRILEGRGKCHRCSCQGVSDHKRRAAELAAAKRNDAADASPYWAHQILNAAREAGRAAAC